MRRMLLATFVLFVIVAAAFAEQGVIKNTCSEMEKEIDAIEVHLAEKSQAALSAAERFEKKWEQKERLLEIFTPHEEIDGLNEDLACLKKSIEIKKYDTAGIILEKMRENFEEIYSKSTIDITNIF